DTWEDLAVSKWANFESGVYSNVAGVLSTTPTWTTGDDGTDKGVAWADVDGVSGPDLVLGHSPTRLYTNSGGSLSLSWSASGTFFGHSDLRWADVDQDGDMDLAEIHFSNGNVHLYLNDGGSLGTVPVWTYDSPGAGTALAFGDLNGDTFPDLVVGNSGDPSVMVFYNRTAFGIPIFSDGFESGDLSAWSATDP
ncbi:MAG: VCBS repeat-containing protein, partial [Acidobacteria bacterium]|nr:VCBS repeat-containing protein [Acidobacteriota bacterium]